MIYRDYEIQARAYVEGSDLFELNDDGSINYSLNIFIEDEDAREIVWYEVGELSHLSAIDNESKETLYFLEVKTIEEIKRRIDLYIDQNPISD